MPTYIGILRKLPDSDYGVDFPDFPGCVTAGATLEEAQKFAIEALELHIEGLVEDGNDVPEPSSLDEVMENAAHRDGVTFLVRVAETRSRVVRVNVTFKEHVLERIDDYASKHRMTRAGFLEDAALKKLAEG
jgi:predicted RNase H-like HicB family nuclease